MARPKQFDRDEALDGAIEIFTDRGFAGASTDAVLEAMQISRQSMYDTFGDKRRLYLEALERYSSRSVDTILQSIESAPTAMAGIEAALLDFAARSEAEASLGCLGVASICEFGVSDGEVNDLNRAAGRRLQSALERAIGDAQQAGDVAADLKVRVAAQFLATTFSGLKIAARGGATRAALKDIARMALRSLAA